MPKLSIRLKIGASLLLVLASAGAIADTQQWPAADRKPYTGNPTVVWHHDIFHADGKPYRQAEVDQIRALTDAAQKAFEKRGKK